MQWLVCSRKFANTAFIWSGNPRKDVFITERPHTSWTVGLCSRTELYRSRPLSTEMESLVTENSNSSKGSTEFELSPDHTTSWKSAWWVVWDSTLLYLTSLYRSLPRTFCATCIRKIHALGDFRVAFRLCFKASPSAKPFIWKLVLFTRKFWFIYMWIKLISIWKASHQDSL